MVLSFLAIAISIQECAWSVLWLTDLFREIYFIGREILAGHMKSSTNTAYLRVSSIVSEVSADDTHFGLCSSHLLFPRAALALTAVSFVAVLKPGDTYQWRHVSQAHPAMEALERRYGLSLDSTDSFA
jgi:hypothetical protein